MDAPQLLDKERERTTFPPEELQQLVSGNPEMRHRMQAIAEADPLLGDKTESVFPMGRKESYALMLQKWHRCISLGEELGLTPGERGTLSMVAGISSGIGLHSGVFVPTIMKQSTPEQLEQWADKLWPQGNWIGCCKIVYKIGRAALPSNPETDAQTEIAHGSNVRGLETTCTFLPDTDEFDVHMPELSSIKWWPGALGVLSNHAVLYARLVVAGEDLGVHNFLVQLRDLETHAPLPGVEVGDIGPKWGTNGNDNGVSSTPPFVALSIV